MTEMNEKAKAYIRFVMRETGLSATSLASKSGISSTTLTRPLNDPEHKFTLSSSTLDKVERFSGISLADFLARKDDSPRDESATRERAVGMPVTVTPGSSLVLPDRMPVYAAAKGGEGHVIVTFEAVDYVKRPAELENVKGGYGLLIYGESMVPAFREGDMALVNPNLPHQRERNVVLYHTPPHGEAEAIVKQLNGWTDTEWILQQWNPAKEFREFRQEWPICHRVVGRYDAR